MNKAAVMLGIGLVLWAGVGGAFAWKKHQSEQRAVERLAVLRKAAAGHLEVPASATFRHERITSNGWLCAEMGARDSSAGAAAYRRVIAAPDGTVFTEDLGYTARQRSGHDPELTKYDREVSLRTLSLMTTANRMNALIADERYKFRVTESRMVEVAVKILFDERWERQCA